MKKPLSDNEIKEIWDTYYQIRDSEAFVQIYKTKQHRTSNTYRHVCMVAKLCALYVIKHHLHYDFKSLIKGAFLHDYYFYDWREEKSKAFYHLIRHPKEALKNAKKRFELTTIEEDIILNHMWPLTLFSFPKTKEGRLVMRMDKHVTFIEFFQKKKKVITFNIDGTLINTFITFQESIKHALKDNNHPLIDSLSIKHLMGKSHLDIIKSLVADNVSKDELLVLLDSLENHFYEHLLNDSFPFEGAYETLIRLRRRGYVLVATGKMKDIILKRLCTKFFPNLFSLIIGNDDNATVDILRNIQTKLKIKNKKKMVYVGSNLFDYEITKKFGVTNVLSSYGYLNKEEILDKGLKDVEIINKPNDLSNLFF